MEVASDEIVDKLLLLPLVVGAPRLVLEDDVVVPPSLHREVLLVQQRIPQRYVLLPGLFLRRRPFRLLLLPTSLAFLADAGEFSLKLGVLVVRVAVGV